MKKIYVGFGGFVALALIVSVISFKKNSTDKIKPLPLSTAERRTLPPVPSVLASTSPIHSVGEVTRHAQPFIHTQVRVKGYLLKREAGYVIFSDEPSGAISKYDLPVKGIGVDTLQYNHLYLLQGLFDDTGLLSSNKNPNNLKLEVPPMLLN